VEAVLLFAHHIHPECLHVPLSPLSSSLSCIGLFQGI
jgi:hypothetical protein